MSIITKVQKVNDLTNEIQQYVNNNSPVALIADYFKNNFLIVTKNSPATPSFSIYNKAIFIENFYSLQRILNISEIDIMFKILINFDKAFKRKTFLETITSTQTDVFSFLFFTNFYTSHEYRIFKKIYDKGLEEKDLSEDFFYSIISAAKNALLEGELNV